MLWTVPHWRLLQTHSVTGVSAAICRRLNDGKDILLTHKSQDTESSSADNATPLDKPYKLSHSNTNVLAVWLCCWNNRLEKHKSLKFKGSVIPSNTMWSWFRPTTMPSGILISPTVCPQFTHLTDQSTTHEVTLFALCSSHRPELYNRTQRTSFWMAA